MEQINWTELFPPYIAPLFSLQFSGSLIPVILDITFAVIIGLAILKYIQYKKSLNGKYVLLEVIPPSISLQSAFTTKQLFGILHALDTEPTFIERFLQLKKRISYEIVSSRNEGIRYIIYTPEEDIPVIRKNLLSYLPGLEIKEIPDYLPEHLPENNYSLTEFRLKHSFTLPLNEQDILNKHDPIAYITGQMTKLDPDELISLQMVTTPVTSAMHGMLTAHLYRLQKRIYDGKEIVSSIHNDSLGYFLSIAKNILFFVFDTTVTIVKTLGKWILEFLTTSTQYQHIAEQERPKGEIKELTPKQKQMQEIVESKINQDLFEVSLRLLIVGKAEKNIALRRKGIVSGFSTFTRPGYQALQVKKPFLESLFAKLNYIRLKYRLFSFTQNPVLSAAELSGIYHFPYTETTQTEDLQSVRSSQLPAPISLKNPSELDIVFARNIHGESTTPVGLTIEERRRHMYVIGATGMGKTTLLINMIYQDIMNGKGVAVIDPHGDLATRLLGIITEKRIEDVVYFNPYDMEFPVGLNVLQMTQGLSDTEKEREKDLIVSSLVSIFFKLYPSASARPRMEHILRNTILATLSTENPTLLTAYKLLVDKNYREKIVAKLDDPILKEFWEKEFKGYGSYQRADLISPITNKLGRFLTTRTTRNILTQEKNKMDFDDIMNNKKILICDLSKGRIGEDISSFLGSLLILKLQLAALNRVHIAPEKRTDFYLYIDEFQNFATMTFAQILSEARKYRLNTILAHQSISQIEEKDLLKVILANVGTVVSFRIGSPDDEKSILPLFKPEVKEHEIANLPAYSFYIKINALKPQNAFTGSAQDFTIEHNADIEQNIIEHSRREYGINAKTRVQKIEVSKEKPEPQKQSKRKGKKTEHTKKAERKRSSI